MLNILKITKFPALLPTSAYKKTYVNHSVSGPHLVIIDASAKVCQLRDLYHITFNFIIL